MLLRALAQSDDRNAFSCGDADLDRFLHRYAGQNQFRTHLGVTYVAVNDDNAILGYATVAPATLEIDQLPAALRKKLPAYPMPVLRLARLAVASAQQGTGVGRALLKYVFTLALKMSEELGCIGVLVDAKPTAIAYYEQYGFMPLELLEGHSQARPAQTAMFLSLSDVLAATT